MRTRHLFTGLAALVLCLNFLGPSLALASINYNRIIDDSVFDSVGTMTASQIDGWLNSNFPNSCISTNKTFLAPDPTGYSPSGGFSYGGNVSAGKVIYDAAKAYGLNPQVLLVTLQKEQSLVSGNAGCSTLRYAAATGYGCPDAGTTYNYSGTNLYTLNGHTVTSVSGTCVNTKSKAGFSQQVIRAAWLLKFGEERSKGNIDWAVIKPGWDNSDDLTTCYGGPMTQGQRKRCPSDQNAVFYDGYTTIDGTSVHMDTGATAALYWYTPHKAGNLNFFNLFTSWFGSTMYLYAADITEQKTYSDEARTQLLVDPLVLKSGEKIYVTIKAKNTGVYTWNQSFTRIATSNPLSRPSAFADGSWLAPSRAAQLVESSTAPGQTGTFMFSMTAPKADKTYSESFRLLADNQPLGWMQGGSTFSLTIKVSNPYNGVLTENKDYRDSSLSQIVDIDHTWLLYGQKIYAQFKFRNSGTQTWDQSFTQMATANPQDRTSLFSDPSWLAANRPASLAQSSVATGQTGTFVVTLKAPTAANNYREYFQLVANGQTSGWMPGTVLRKTIKVLAGPPRSLESSQKMYPGYSLKSGNGKYQLKLQVDGNLVLSSNGKGLWSSRTAGRPALYLVMQSNGNLVLYDRNNQASWRSHTSSSGSKLALQNDGNLVIYNSKNQAVWSARN